MNLEVEIRQVRERLGEPARDDQADNYITDREIVDWIHAAEHQIIQDVADDALTDLHGETSETTVNGTESYALATNASDFLRLLDVRLDTGMGLVECDLINPKQRRQLYESPTWRPTAAHPFAWLYGASIYVAPIPGSEAGAGKLKIRYVKQPNRRFKHDTGLTDAAGITTTLVDAGLRTEPDDYWNSGSVRLKTGILAGEERTVSDFDNGTNTITVSSAFSGTPGTGIYYEIGEVSDVGEEFNPLIISWATYLAYLKDREVDLAQDQKQRYDMGVQKINARYGAYHRQEPVREVAR